MRSSSPADHARLTAFVAANPDWPGIAALRRRAEETMPAALPPEEVLRRFRDAQPLTAGGAMRLIGALLATGDAAGAAQLARARWIAGSFDAAEEAEFLARFGSVLRPDDHWARLDRMIWDGEATDARRRMLDLVPPGRRALADARLRLQQQAPGADQAAARVPGELADDPGLHYERVRWARRADRPAEAVALLLDAPTLPGRPAPWWTERHILLRDLLERGDAATAYRLAAEHGQPSGLPFAQAEWTAGWIALRFLDRPADALRHFETLWAGVSTPISRSRAGYWAGRAEAARGRAAQARAWYERAGEHPGTFYGQLALQELGISRLPIPAEHVVEPADVASFDADELVRVSRALLSVQRADRSPLGEQRVATFLRRVAARAETAAHQALAGRLALEAGRRDIAIAAAKSSSDAFLVQAGYPTLETAKTSRPEPALVHGVIRQESVFDTDAVSRAGARGLMQLMPGTAEEVSRRLGERYTRARLTGDPEFNVRLGSTYLQDMIERFNGSYVLAVAAYNAGPGRVRQWLERFGDPRAEGVDVIDWIEMIPIYETRNYVQRVLEATQVYRQRLEGNLARLALAEDLRR
jgi:soluble lytic murein transglycosylase